MRSRLGDDQRSPHPLVSLPGRAQIGPGRVWHGVVTIVWVLNGLLYVVAFLNRTTSRQRQRQTFTEKDISPFHWGEHPAPNPGAVPSGAAASRT